MSELIREFKTQNGSSCYIYACETCGCETMRFRRAGRGRVICGVCKRKEEKAYTKAKWDAKLQEAYEKGKADELDKISKMMLLGCGDIKCEECYYRAYSQDVCQQAYTIGIIENYIAEQLKEQKQIE